MTSELTPINKVPPESVVEIVRLGGERLRDLGLQEGSIVTVTMSVSGGPVLVQKDDGATVVIDSETSLSTLVRVVAAPPGRYRHRRRLRFGRRWL
ncbi:MAG: FeoA domain-containing protein [Acidilobus sp.]